MSLLRIQLRNDRAGIIGWSVGLFLLALSVGASYAAIEDDAAAIEEAFENFGGVEEAFGVDSLTSPDGYFKSNSVALYPLLLGIYGGLAATRPFAGAQEQGRLDHILARPLTRWRYFAASSGGLLLAQCIIVASAALGGTLGYVLADQPADVVGGVLAMSLEVLPIAVVHVCLGILVGSIWSSRGPAVATVIGIVVGGFAIDLLSKLVDALDWLQYLNAYGYWSRSDWFNGDVDPWYLLVSILVAGAALLGAGWRFDRKDL